MNNTSRQQVRMAALLIVFAGLCAYSNSFEGPFLFDDKPAIPDNPTIRFLSQPWRIIANTMRPVTDLSFALNYALGGLEVVGYHALNLTIHLLAALALFGLVRRTLSGQRLPARYGLAAPDLALTITLLWLVHPLQTQSVTYVIQRAESLMGLLAFLTLYALCRSATAPNPGRWQGLAVLACGLGMGSKPVMVTVPLLALLYDRVFLAGSFKAALRLRRGLYVGLSLTWVLLAVLLTNLTRVPEPNAGFGFKEISPLAYALTQPGVILHYLRLSLWPHPLVFDYAWPVARTLEAILVPSLIIGWFVLATLWALRRQPPLGFLGAWFFVTLAPTSSVIPIEDVAFEYRMYLPLAAVVSLVVLGGWELLRRSSLPGRLPEGLAMSIVTAIALTFGIMTVQRNADYRSELALWSDVVAKRPGNPRAHNNLGWALAEQGRLEAAAAAYQDALRLKPDFAEAHNGLGLLAARQGTLEEAIARYTEALRIDPHYAEAHNNLGTVLLRQGRLEEAEAHFHEALRAHPTSAPVYYNVGNALAQQGNFEEAIAHYAQALRLNPSLAEAHNNWGNVLTLQGRLDEAMAHYRHALSLNPALVKAQKNVERIQAMARAPEAGPAP